MKFNYADFIASLSARINTSLPGMDAHVKMAPMHRKSVRDYLSEVHTYRTAAVLALLFPDNKTGSPRIVLMERAGGGDVHAHQISFPGGKQEPDEELADTALRESFEELGIASQEVNLIGLLTSLYIPPSGFLVHPFIGFLHQDPVFTINPAEVKRVITPSLEQLCNGENLRSGSFRSSQGIVVKAPCYELEDVVIWGATAMMISEIVEVVNSLK
ncbi:MAG: CoA pyrophosphatase [Bacteroidetes bacterium]|nr:CoA pyrophosphatase [Bacteroidota bacterium]